MDGWNIYYVMYYLAQLGGVPPAQQQIWVDGFVPEEPYDACPNGADAFYLPVGVAGSSLTDPAARDLRALVPARAPSGLPVQQ